MKHERVRTDVFTGRPIANGIGDGYVRLGFCDRSLRQKSIACAHTMARYALEKGMTAVPESVRLVLQSELRIVTEAIHALDHRKGAVEKALARLSESANPPEAELCRARDEIESLERQHDACVESIAHIRDEVLAHLDARIATENLPSIVQASTHKS